MRLQIRTGVLTFQTTARLYILTHLTGQAVWTKVRDKRWEQKDGRVWLGFGMTESDDKDN